MSKVEIRHSVIIKTFNQEGFIRETLDSVLRQEVLPHEIIVGDDCSQDSTYQILESYDKEHPGLFKIYRNEVNMGLYQNAEKAKKLITGNVLNFLGGDDMLGPKALVSISQAIIDNNLNPESERFLIITNSMDLFPNGNKTLNNNYYIRNKSVVKERLRYGLDYRRIGISYLLEKSNREYDFQLGAYADWVHDFYEVINADTIVFINEVGAIYRRYVGITSRLKRTELVESQTQALSQVETLFAENFDKADRRMIKFLYAKNEYIISKTFTGFFKSIYYYLANINNFSSNSNFIYKAAFLIPDSWIGFAKKILYRFSFKPRG